LLLDRFGIHDDVSFPGRRQPVDGSFITEQPGRIPRGEVEASGERPHV
jgi:hypothetical protein